MRTGGKAFLVVKGPCDLSCLFCNFLHTSPAVEPLGHERELRRQVADLARGGADRLVWGDGDHEPTAFPHLARLIAYARGKGFADQELNTSAVRTSDIGYLKELQGAGLTQLNLSVFEYDAPSADAFCGASRVLQRKRRTLANCRALGIPVVASLLLMRANYRKVESILRLFAQRTSPVKKCLISSIHSTQQGLAGHFLAPFSGLLQELDRALPRWPHLDFEVMSVPNCLVEKHFKPVPNVRFQGSVAGVFPDACAGCAAKRDCCGVPPPYAALYGADELLTRKVIHNPIGLGELRRLCRAPAARFSAPPEQVSAGSGSSGRPGSTGPRAGLPGSRPPSPAIRPWSARRRARRRP